MTRVFLGFKIKHWYIFAVGYMYYRLNNVISFHDLLNFTSGTVRQIWGYIVD